MEPSATQGVFRMEPRKVHLGESRWLGIPIQVEKSPLLTKKKLHLLLPWSRFLQTWLSFRGSCSAMECQAPI